MNINRNMIEAIEILDNDINDPTTGLPEEIFLFISRNLPVIGVDLLIKDENNRTLLSWRDDKYSGTGWHIPGGILRLKEILEDRVKKVAEIEINTEIEFDHIPLKIVQFILNQKERCHVISFLYKCYLPSTFIPDNKNLLKNDAGFLMWHDKCPDNLIEMQEIYRNYINNVIE